MEKIAYLYSFETSSWKSCQTITKNLITCYSSIFNSFDQKHFNLNVEQSIYDILKTAKEIQNFNPSKIIFLDHKPHPLILLKTLSEIMSHEVFKNIELIFHIFGDYTLYSYDWSELGDLLHQMKVRFFCASDRQVELVRSFLIEGEALVKKLPFFVDENEFFYSSKLSDDTKKNFNFSSKDILLLYTGRLSQQKNVFQLILEFAKAAKNHENIKLLIAGNFDDLGNPFTGIWYHENEYYQKYLELINELDQNIKDRISYLGNLSTDSLNKIYNASDIYISMSAHNDEDFGMSPAEAMVTGLPTILTNWAGYYSFHVNDPENCSLVPVEYKDNFIDFDRDSFQTILAEHLEKISSFRKNRIHISQKAIKYLSVKQNTLVLNNFLNSPAPRFKGHSDKIDILKQSFLKSPPFLNPETLTYTTQYFKIYECYLPKKL